MTHLSTENRHAPTPGEDPLRLRRGQVIRVTNPDASGPDIDVTVFKVLQPLGPGSQLVFVQTYEIFFALAMVASDTVNVVAVQAESGNGNG